MISHKERLRAVHKEPSTPSKRDILSAMVESTGPQSPPSEEEILSLILGELSSVCHHWIRHPLSE